MGSVAGFGGSTEYKQTGCTCVLVLEAAQTPECSQQEPASKSHPQIPTQILGAGSECSLALKPDPLPGEMARIQALGPVPRGSASLPGPSSWCPADRTGASHPGQSLSLPLDPLRTRRGEEGKEGTFTELLLYARHPHYPCRPPNLSGPPASSTLPLPGTIFHSFAIGQSPSLLRAVSSLEVPDHLHVMLPIILS